MIGDGAARPQVEAAFAPLAPDRGGPRVHFAGELDSQGVAASLAVSDLFVWPAVNEAYGMALLEAQAAGLPVVAGRVGGVPAVVAEGDSGLLTEPGDAGAFATALRELLGDPGRRRAFAEGALKQVQAGHDLSAAARQLDDILHEATGLSARTAEARTAP